MSADLFSSDTYEWCSDRGCPLCNERTRDRAEDRAEHVEREERRQG